MCTYAGRRYLITILCCVISLTVNGRGGTGSDGPDRVCVLTDEQHNYRLIDYVGVLPDPDGELTIDGVRQSSFAPAADFPSPEANHYYWGKLRVSNRLPRAERQTEWVLYFSGTWTELEVYTADADGNWSVERNGTFLPPAEKPFVPTTKGNLVKLTLPPGEVTTVYFRGRSERVSLAPSFHLYLQTTEVFYDKLLKRKAADALFIGFLGMMFLYNLMLYFFGRDRSFVYYSGYILMMIVYGGYFSDDLSDWFGQYLFPGRPQNYSFFKLSIFLGLMCYLMFIRTFVHLPRLLPRWDRYFRGLIWLGAVMMGVYVWVSIASNHSYAIEDRITVAYIAIVIGSCVGLLFPLYRRWNKQGAFIFYGIAALSLGCLLSLLTRVAVPPFSLFWLKAGVIVEVAIFSLGLAYRQRKQVQAREQAVFALRESKLLQEKQQLEASRLQELTDFKTRFYTNITHEFRTPLTVIMGMSDQISGQEKIKDLIQRNGRNLLNLVNRLLELSRLEMGATPVNWVHDDIIAYLNYLTESFYSAAEQKNIRFVFYSEVRELMMDFDEEKVLQIVNNLISNALKFTPPRGKIIVHASTTVTDTGTQLKLIVRDTGIGISAEDAEHIFDRYFQVTPTEPSPAAGSGVGLALTRELVGLLGGTIGVDSEPGKGTEFTVLLPVGDAHRSLPAESVAELPDPDRPVLLIIEDNRDIVTYLETILGDRYGCHYAADGEAGIELALQLVPDVIVSDVMMPKKDGYEVCETLKADERTSHIPIILLTAKTTPDARIQGLKFGADAYLTKPFDKEELNVRIEKLIESRRRLRTRYAGAGNATVEANGTPESREDAFVRKLHDLIGAQLDDANFGVAELAAAAGLSQMQLYRKVKAITGKTPSRFIRSYRLAEGMQLLRTGGYTVSEIAYRVGFSDPSYFSRTFQQEYRHPPSHFVTD
ncbi:signal transduction histidine kinase/DNA-binding response OmpR family regulator [Lewinella aquimaris]|uniref:histidine kinase n=1 Tax=Neolewinella aquimaris TaxID=1835722 RepID=A0A840EFZ6_9BACT|nr:ATP-binding protein [Neolewinella aquimaris]MBB4080838.1 signal transduction histidine kinase/DNA-binding response OmpR family regulator [Neolewinella aquimaris]